jgi:hypothetical protein
MEEDQSKKTTGTVKSSFNLNDLMNIGQNPEIQQQLQGMMGEQFNQFQKSEKEGEKELSKEELRKKLRAKMNQLSSQRQGKEVQQQKQIEQLKSNPMVQSMGNKVDINMLIDQVMKQNNIPNTPQHRKNVKKQVEALMSKMNP